MKFAFAFILAVSYLSGCGGENGGVVTAESQSDAGMIVAGLGRTQCDAFLEDLQKSEKAKGAYTTWIQGYLSGRNVARIASGLRLVFLNESEEPFRHVKQYCEENPLKPLGGGAESVWKELTHQTPD